MTHKDEIRAIRAEDFEAEMQRRRGSGGGGRPPGLWEQFQRALDDWTHPARTAARKVINTERFALDERLQAGTSQELLDLKTRLDRDFSDVVNGGARGAWVAVRSLAQVVLTPKNT